jgi:hypothetical protein
MGRKDALSQSQGKRKNSYIKRRIFYYFALMENRNSPERYHVRIGIDAPKEFAISREPDKND